MTKVKENFDRKLKVFENDIGQRKQTTFSDVTKQSTEFIEDSSYPTKIKAPSFDGNQSCSTYHKQFEAAAAAGRWLDAEKAAALILAYDMRI